MRPRARAVDPERQAVVGKVPGKLPLGNTGLDDGVAELGIDMLDPIHPAKIHDDLPFVDRARVAVAPVLSRADRIQRRLAAARGSDELHDFVPRAWLQDGRRTPAGRRDAPGVPVKGSLVEQYVNVAKQRPPLRERTGQVAAGIEGTDDGIPVVAGHVALCQSLRARRSNMSIVPRAICSTTSSDAPTQPSQLLTTALGFITLAATARRPLAT
jgi:hypothetical protein